MGERFIRLVTILGLVPSLGPVILFDDIEDLLKWSGSGTGADWTVEKSQTVVYNKDQALHLITKSTTPADGDQVQAERSIITRPGKRYRIELLFHFTSGTAEEFVQIKINIQDGTYLHSLGLHWHPVAERWYYLASDNTFTWLEGMLLRPGENNWHRLLLEWDQNAVKYIRMVCDAEEFDMSSLAYRKEGGIGKMSGHIYLSVEAAGAAQAECYFDDILALEI